MNFIALYNETDRFVTGQILGSHKRKSSKRKARLEFPCEHREHQQTGIPGHRDGR